MDRSDQIAVFPLYGTGDPIFDLSPVRDAIAAGDRAGLKESFKRVAPREYGDGTNARDLVESLRSSGMSVAFISPIADVYLRILLAHHHLEADFRAAGVEARTFSAGLTAVMRSYPDARRVCVFAGDNGALEEVMRRRAQGESRLMSLGRASSVAETQPSWAPDVIWKSTENLLASEGFESLRYLGELESAGRTAADLQWHPGSVIRDSSERLYSLGRYFAKGRMPELHEAHRHSQRILAQKQTSSPRFEDSFTEFLTRLAGQTNIDLVWSVPCTTGWPGQMKTDRLQWYRQTAARLLGAEESTQIRESQQLESPLKGLGHQARLAANANRFTVDGELVGMTILLIDDVWTTGSTLNAVTEVARAAGATSVIKVVFGLNQVPPVPHRQSWYAADPKYLQTN